MLYFFGILEVCKKARILIHKIHTLISSTVFFKKSTNFLIIMLMMMVFQLCFNQINKLYLNPSITLFEMVEINIYYQETKHLLKMQYFDS